MSFNWWSTGYAAAFSRDIHSIAESLGRIADALSDDRWDRLLSKDWSDKWGSLEDPDAQQGRGESRDHYDSPALEDAHESDATP